MSEAGGGSDRAGARHRMLPLKAFISTLGIAQIISWGSLFYSIGVLGGAMRRDLGVSELFVFGSFTAGLLVSGTFAPLAGRVIDARGGRFVLSVGSVLAAVAMAVLAAAWHPYVLVAGWLIAGAAMAACLYDPAFATLSQHTGERYRRAVTALTLFGGFASTVFWPLSHLLMEAYGWRATLGIYAALHLAVCLPIHLVFVPKLERAAREGPHRPELERSPAMGDPRLHWLTACFALGTFIFGVIAVHLINLLTSAGLTAAQAVTVSMLVGPMQVAGRIIEFGFAGRVRAVVVGYVAFALMLVALAALFAVDGMGVAAIVFVVAYGCSNGVLTIVKGTTPAELFGRQGIGGLLGHLSRAGFYAKSVAPASYSALLTIGLTRSAALGALAGLALFAMGSYSMATKPRAAPKAAAAD
ncbi:MAG TPA: MFS transporter [Usitatibacter sp.]|nr:MFS transporter [Usitatibacter sp.]